MATTSTMIVTGNSKRPVPPPAFRLGQSEIARRYGAVKPVRGTPRDLALRALIKAARALEVAARGVLEDVR